MKSAKMSSEQIIEIADAAEALAEELQLSGHDIEGIDILDALASAGLVMAKGNGQIASKAYEITILMLADREEQ